MFSFLNLAMFSKYDKARYLLFIDILNFIKKKKVDGTLKFCQDIKGLNTVV